MIKKRYRKYDYSDYKKTVSKYLKLDRAIHIISILMAIFLSTIFLKVFLPNCSGSMAYYLELIFHVFMPLSFVLFFIIAVIGIIKETKDGKHYRDFKDGLLRYTVILFVILCIVLSFFIPVTIKLIKDLPYCLKSNFVESSGVLTDVTRGRVDGRFTINGIQFKTEVFKYRNLMYEGKTAEVLYLPHSKFLVQLKEN